MADVDPSCRPRIGEPLGGEGDASGLAGADPAHVGSARPAGPASLGTEVPADAPVRGPTVGPVIEQMPVDETTEPAPRFRLAKAMLAFCAVGAVVAAFPVAVQGIFTLF